MTRPVGLILSTIVLSFAAIFLLLMTALMAFAGVHAGPQLSAATSPHLYSSLVLALSAFYAILAVWAILTVIGILRLRSWARVSISIIGGGLAVIGVLAMLGTLLSRILLPTLATQQPAIDPHTMSTVLMILAAVDMLFASIGIWWLFYFNRRATRQIFSDSSSILTHPPHGAGRFSGTPVGIKILSGLFLLSSITCLVWAILPFPAFFLGFILPPAASHGVYLCFAALGAFIAYGLLRLKESVRILALGFITLGCCNTALIILPWYQAQFRLYMTQVTSAIATVPGQPRMYAGDSVKLIVVSGLFGLIVNGFLLWILHRYRAAFQAPAPPPLEA